MVFFVVGNMCQTLVYYHISTINNFHVCISIYLYNFAINFQLIIVWELYCFVICVTSIYFERHRYHILSWYFKKKLSKNSIIVHYKWHFWGGPKLNPPPLPAAGLRSQGVNSNGDCLQSSNKNNGCFSLFGSWLQIWQERQWRNATLLSLLYMVSPVLC